MKHWFERLMHVPPQALKMVSLHISQKKYGNAAKLLKLYISDHLLSPGEGWDDATEANKEKILDAIDLILAGQKEVPVKSRSSLRAPLSDLNQSA